MRQFRTLRFALAAGLIAFTAILLQARGRTEIIPARLPLTSFPEQLGDWKGKDIPLDKDTLDVLGPGDFLVRDYYTPDQSLPINLYIAYFPSQRTGDTIHSPKNCLPGSGWEPTATGYAEVAVEGEPLPIRMSRGLLPAWFDGRCRRNSSRLTK